MNVERPIIALRSDMPNSPPKPGNEGGSESMTFEGMTNLVPAHSGFSTPIPTTYLLHDAVRGVITIQDHRNAAGPNAQADRRVAIDEFFAGADIDGDGWLSQEEFEAAQAKQDVQNYSFSLLYNENKEDKFAREDVLVARRLLAQSVDLVPQPNPTIDDSV